MNEELSISIIMHNNINGCAPDFMGTRHVCFPKRYIAGKFFQFAIEKNSGVGCNIDGAKHAYYLSRQLSKSAFMSTEILKGILFLFYGGLLEHSTILGNRIALFSVNRTMGIGS